MQHENSNFRPCDTYLVIVTEILSFYDIRGLIIR